MSEPRGYRTDWTDGTSGVDMSGAAQQGFSSLGLGTATDFTPGPAAAGADFLEPPHLVALTIIALVGDLIAILCAFCLSYVICGILVPDFHPPRTWFGALVLITMIASIAEQGDYGAAVLVERRIRPWMLAKACLQTVGAVILLAFPAIIVTKQWLSSSPDPFQISGMAPSALFTLEFIFLGVAYSSILGERVVRRAASAPLAHPRRIVLVGQLAHCNALMNSLERSARQLTKIVGLLHHVPGAAIAVTAERPCNLPVLDSPDELIKMAHDGRVDTIIVASPWSEHTSIRDLVHRLASAPIDVLLSSDFDSLGLPSTPNVAPVGVSLWRAIHPPLLGWQAFVKRAEDIVIAGFIVFLTAPALMTIATLVRLTSPGPILFRQKRIGYKGHVFEALKFRTMYVDVADATGAKQTTRGDARVTRFGAWLRRRSLDELPQILNVLRGDMSMVGPRPHPIGMTAFDGLPLEEATPNYSLRYRVRPGLTGWAQVNGNRGPIHTRDKIVDRVTLDLEYIRDWSLLLDLRIVCLTIALLYNDENAF
jgi:exopolysaccharide biosynthesis polyprenyl glycosylphosphotransferase